MAQLSKTTCDDRVGGLRDGQNQRFHDQPVVFVAFTKFFIRFVDCRYRLTEMVAGKCGRRSYYLFGAVAPHAHTQLLKERLRL